MIGFIENTDTSDIRKMAYKNGEFQILPYSAWAQHDPVAIRLFLHEEALYSIPTEEVVEFIDELIGEHTAIEIGAGHGLWGRELDIPLTDSKLQERPEVKLMYLMAKQPLIKYPQDIIKLRASDAIKRFKPHTVFASYFTPICEGAKYMEGDEVYRDDERLFPNWGVKRYIKIGSINTHGNNPLMKLAHEEHNPIELITRAEKVNQRIFIWNF